MKPISRSDWLSQVPYGQLVTRTWLLAQGVSVHAIDNALKSAKLVAPARGVFARPGVAVTWEGVVASLGRLLPEPVYVGGLSALSEAGLSHYLDSAGRLHLYSPAAAPPWLYKLPVQTEFVWHGTARLWDTPALLSAASLRETPFAHGNWKVASPEQAILEVMAEVPDSVSFEHADNLMQGLASLSPRRLDALLHACRHVRAKRLFFFFADRHQHPWRQHLDAASYDLGKGKRHIVAEGKLDSVYHITVPESFHGQE